MKNSSWIGTIGKLNYTCTSLIKRKFRLEVNPNRRQNSFVWRINTWILNEWRGIVSRNLEWNVKSFWCLQEQLFHRRRQFEWLRKHFKTQIRGIFLVLVIMSGPKNSHFSFKKLLWSILHSYICTELVIFFY